MTVDPRMSNDFGESSKVLEEESVVTDNDHDLNKLQQQFICQYCDKDFRRPDILSRHLRRHTGEKPFGCDCCGHWFSRSDHLRTHRRTHTDDKPYRCTACPYAAGRRDVLTRHMSTTHHLKAARTFFPRQRLSKNNPIVAGGIVSA